MKKLILVLLLIVNIGLLSGCFKERTELFDISVVTGTFSYEGDEGIEHLQKTITSFSLTFADIGKTTEKLDNYEINEFGDFSSDIIILYSILIEISFDGVVHDCDAVFMGAANPQRPNAYRILVTIPDLSEEQDEFRIILDFDEDRISVQIVDEISSSANGIDATFDIFIQDNEQ